MEVVLSEAESLFAQNMPQKEKQTDSIGKIFPNKQKTAHNAISYKQPQGRKH